MEIGDKVKFNKYLPIKESGDTKLADILVTELIPDPTGGLMPSGKLVKRKFRPWYSHRDGNHVSWSILKCNISETEGVYIGSLRKKLCRTYLAPISDDPSTPRFRNRDNNPMFHTISVDRVNPRNGLVTRDLVPRPSHWTSKNPRRVDDPNKLDELAIIAVSKTKRYVVDMKDIFEYNFKSKVKIV